MLSRYALLLALAGSAVFSPSVFGEPVTTIRDNGDSANRVDLVVLGDGYTAAEMEKFASDAENAVDGFFAAEPFHVYRRFFNVHRVDVESAESGADHPEDRPPSNKKTAFDATYNCAGIARLICINHSKVNAVLNRSVDTVQRDLVLVLVNDTEYGGSGGSIMVASLHALVIELVLHEVGHGFGLLADEYETSPPACNDAVEPPEVNVTRETNRSSIKWNSGGGPPTGWIDPGTEIPTESTDPGIPGLYEGAKYCRNGLFRPTYDSKMRTLGPAFEQINEEQLVKRIYNWVSPIDSSIPESSTIQLVAGKKENFEITVPASDTHPVSVAWHVDNTEVGTGWSFSFDSDRFDTGTHSVRVAVLDLTPKVRHDPTNLLSDERVWTVTVNPDPYSCFGEPATVIGTEGNDRLRGTARDDVIVGLGGNDRIAGKGGDDRICGGEGNDIIRGGSGNDTVSGGSGNDVINGGRGNDNLSGDDANDVIKGGSGSDTLDGGNGVDVLKGGRGADVCVNGEVTVACP